jgi:predicted RNase H-like HicB family nuclease
MANYIAVVHKDPKSDYGVSIPDFLGFITVGSTIDEAKNMAQQALPFHIKGMLQDGETIPKPSALEDILNNPDYADAAAFLVVHIPGIRPKTMRINITVPEDTLKQIDIMAKKRGMSRSSFLVHAARNAE